jgi:hypothetical protein
MRHPRHHDVLNCLSAGLQKRATQQDEADGLRTSDQHPPGRGQGVAVRKAPYMAILVRM